MPPSKPIRLTKHALEQCAERGTNEEEVRRAIGAGRRERAERGRLICRQNFQYNGWWQGKRYAIKQVAPVIAEDQHEIVVITVYTFYF